MVQETAPFGALEELTRGRFGGPTTSRENPINTAISTSVTAILRSNPDRVGWLITNVGSFDIYLGYDAEVSATNGVPIQAGGGTAIVSFEEDGMDCGLPVFGLAPSGASTVFVRQLIRLPIPIEEI
tara:strand:- start:7341 stop:7718 length:378 start_codon:yes stop_codon:yes gene_type:complete